MTNMHAQSPGRGSMLQHADKHVRKRCALRAQFLRHDPGTLVVKLLCLTASRHEPVS